MIRQFFRLLPMLISQLKNGDWLRPAGPIRSKSSCWEVPVPLFQLAVMVFWIAFGVETAVFAQAAGSADSDSAAGDSKPASKPPKARQRVTMKLPDEYRSKDTDKDGQIGMYEWSRTDYATFRKLDLNGDGFLTPQELSRGGRSRRSPPAFVATNREPVKTTASATPSAPATVDAPAAGASAAPTAGKSDAERQFELIDKDKNDKITEEEFQKSTLTRINFTKAGIALTFPVQRDEFLRLYPGSK